MKNIKYNNTLFALFLVVIVLFLTQCERDVEGLDPASYSTNGDIFIDGFSAGLNYAAFGGSDVTAFDVDEKVKYKGTSSMRFDIPNEDSPSGSYAGGVYFTNVGRNLSGYTALTFWAKASKSEKIALIGFGNDLGESKYQASLKDVKVSTKWTKYYIPIPDPSKLKAERGMFYYSEGPEEGAGYTFWIDEVKFEKLGTIAHPQPVILEAQDQEISAETGDKLNIGGLYTSFNLPTGVDQRVETAHSYFNFISSETSVASVNELGVVSILDSGAVVITATLNEQDALGSLSIQSTGEPILPSTLAPTPTVHPDSVISLFCNEYIDVPVDTWNTHWLYSTAELKEVNVDGDDMKQYKKLNFVGIEFSSQTVDASEMTHFHLDLWTPDPTEAPKTFKIALIDFGADGTFDGGDDSSHEISFTSPTLVTENWVSIDIPISNFSGLTGRANLAQMVFAGEVPNVFIDNVYFYKSDEVVNPTGPTEAAPTPNHNESDVISIYSDSYTNVENTEFYADWGQSTAVSEQQIEGNNTLKYAGLNYQGIVLESSLDVSGMKHLHIDYWTDNSTSFNTFLISSGPTEAAKAFAVPTDGWNSIDIPLGDFSPVDLADLIQFKFDGNGDIYLDNIYFYKDGGSNPTEPTTAAPVPTHESANVISVFSDVYTDIDGTDFNPDWGQSTVVTTEQIQGDNTLKYASFNYQGTQFGSEQDVSNMKYLHLDMWTADATVVQMTPISSGSGENLISLDPINSGKWNSYDIALTEFTNAGMTLNDFIQIKFDGQSGTVPSTIYLDNIYFYTDGGGNPTEPTTAAPTPTQNAAEVISVFSDSYSNVDGTDFYADWGQATVVSEESIQGNNTLKYAGLNYQGIVLGNSLNVAGMDYLHIDYWTANSTALTTFLISSGPVETAKALSVPTSGWVSIDIPLSDFSPVDLADIIQFKFEGDGDIWLDNIYFYKEGGSSGEWSTSETIDFESSGFGAGWTWSVFENESNPPLEFVANPDPSGVNTSTTVAKITAFQAGQPWVGCETLHGDIGSFSFNSNNAIVRIMVYKTVISDVGLKFAEVNGEAQPEVKVANTKINEWEELTFDLSGSIGAGITGIIDQIIVFPDFDARTQDNVIYFDNITFHAN